MVYLHTRGSSRRGPSFRLPFHLIKASNCNPLLRDHSDWTQSLHSPSSDDRKSAHASYIDSRAGMSCYELYIPAPSYYNRAEAFQYHLNTRNFFAWMFNKAAVGLSLAHATVSLWESMKRFRSVEEDNIRSLLEYVNAQSYLDFRECPDHAVAALHLAEQAKIRHLYIDAFAHCVGMNDRLVSSPSFEVSDIWVESRRMLNLDIANKQRLESVDNQSRLRNGHTNRSCRKTVNQLPRI